ncbi:MAG: arginyltransferase [Thermodesulfobacteriota bacterium]
MQTQTAATTDLRVSREERPIHFQREIERYFFDTPADCPYGLGRRAVYRQMPVVDLPAELYGLLLAAGFRRNGNTLYRMVCPDCRGCVSIRLDCGEFRPNRNQRRVAARNAGVAMTAGPLEVTDEKIDLLDRFLAARYPGRGSDGREYYAGFFLNRMTATFEIEYRIGDRLMGVAIVDVGDDWLNGVYHYFDPDLAGRSPGTNNVLRLVDFCRRARIRHFYLGYQIDEVPAMAYKTRFFPHQLLIDGMWQRQEKPA